MSGFERTHRALAALVFMTKDNSTIRVKDKQTLAQGKGKLLSITFEQRRRDGSWQERKREVYDNGNSAVILPYDAERNTVLLTLRLPIYLLDGFERAIEACAGKLDEETAEKRIVKEVEEELGYRIEKWIGYLNSMQVQPPSRKKLRSLPAPIRRRTRCPMAVAWLRRAKISR